MTRFHISSAPPWTAIAAVVVRLDELHYLPGGHVECGVGPGHVQGAVPVAMQLHDPPADVRLERAEQATVVVPARLVPR